MMEVENENKTPHKKKQHEEKRIEEE